MTIIKWTVLSQLLSVFIAKNTKLVVCWTGAIFGIFYAAGIQREASAAST